MTIQTIQFGDEGQVATRELLKRFEALRPEVAGHLRTLEALDRQYGGSGVLPVEDAGDLVAAALAQMAHLETTDEFADLTLGIALWALRHGIPIDVVEPVANALAVRSNRAATAQELAAVFGLMQGLIAHVEPRLGPDLERSNPERPWRILHANLAITAIRTEDPALMDYAFDALDRALPDEAAGFYSEALARSLNPRISPVVRERISARHLKWITAG
ncbi:MAG: hypothetical protein M3R58_04840 [Pseudomonadota bacterium]|nr:hypothetical protein [Pseudomonadota bacterium]